MDLLVLIGVPALLAALVAVAVTVAIERLGGIWGGLLGTLPTTIVPASVGIWLVAPDPRAFAAAMGAVPVGMLIDAVFLWLWRVLPPTLPRASLSVRLVGMVGLTLTAWALLAGLGVLGLQWVRAEGLSIQWIGAAALLANIGIGAAACLRRVPAPKGTRAVSSGVMVARGVLAGLAIAVSTGLAHVGGDLLAGVASVFPAIFLTTMVALWISQDEAVPAGAVGPMMLGASSVGAYALLVAVALPAMGLGMAVGLAWLGAAVGITVPAALWLRRRGQNA